MTRCKKNKKNAMHREVLFTFSPGDKRKNRGGYLRQEIEMKMCRGEQMRLCDVVWCILFQGFLAYEILVCAVGDPCNISML